MPLFALLTILLAVIHEQLTFQHRWLQSVLNATTRLIYRSSRRELVTPLLRDLRWLRPCEWPTVAWYSSSCRHHLHLLSSNRIQIL